VPDVRSLRRCWALWRSGTATIIPLALKPVLRREIDLAVSQAHIGRPQRTFSSLAALSAIVSDIEAYVQHRRGADISSVPLP